MTAIGRKVFRIEEGAREARDPFAVADERHAELMAAVATLRADLAKGVAVTGAAPVKADDTAREVLDLYKAELNEARKLKRELDAIRSAIAETKREIASLHQSNQTGGAMSRVSDELDAIVSGTENATNAIREAAEVIDGRSADLAAKLKGDDQGMAGDIQEQVVRIFEACNFQDLTGQRIGKIVAVLHFVDERVGKMMDIWGGISSFKDVVPSIDDDALDEEAKLLNGPALPRDEGRATQSMIDALFE